MDQNKTTLLETDELHQNNDAQRIRRMMLENRSGPIPSLRGIDAFSEFNNVICNIRVKNLDELINFLRAVPRLVYNKGGVIANNKKLKEPYWKRRIEYDIARFRKNLSQTDDQFKVDRRTSNIEEYKKVTEKDLGGTHREISDPLQTDDARKFWSEILDKTVPYKEIAEQLVKIEKELEVVKIQNNVVITKEDVIKQVCKMPN